MTGELIRPLAIETPPQEGDIPIAKAAIGYAVPGLDPRISPGAVLLALFSPTNAIVMVFILLFHLLMQASLAIIKFAFPAIAVVACTFCILAHYGCIVQEIGQEDRDELPRPLRGLSWSDDLWRPFCAVMAPLLFCYAPATATLIYYGFTQRGLFISGSLAALGTILFPAMMLTQATSGHAANLRPDRLLGVIRMIGWRYVLVVFIWLITFAFYVAGLWGLELATLGVMWWRWEKLYWMFAFVTLMVGVYLAHFFSWQLGLHYRAKHPYFPWILQRHVKRTDKEKLAIQRAANAARLRSFNEGR